MMRFLNGILFGVKSEINVLINIGSMNKDFRSRCLVPVRINRVHGWILGILLAVRFTGMAGQQVVLPNDTTWGVSSNGFRTGARVAREYIGDRLVLRVYVFIQNQGTNLHWSLALPQEEKWRCSVTLRDSKNSASSKTSYGKSLKIPDIRSEPSIGRSDGAFHRRWITLSPRLVDPKHICNFSLFEVFTIKKADRYQLTVEPGIFDIQKTGEIQVFRVPPAMLDIDITSLELQDHF